MFLGVSAFWIRRSRPMILQTQIGAFIGGVFFTIVLVLSLREPSAKQVALIFFYNLVLQTILRITYGLMCTLFERTFR